MKRSFVFHLFSSIVTERKGKAEMRLIERRDFRLLFLSLYLGGMISPEICSCRLSIHRIDIRNAFLFIGLGESSFCRGCNTADFTAAAPRSNINLMDEIVIYGEATEDKRNLRKKSVRKVHPPFLRGAIKTKQVARNISALFEDRGEVIFKRQLLSLSLSSEG